jgi:hypothetical protein
MRRPFFNEPTSTPYWLAGLLVATSVTLYAVFARAEEKIQRMVESEYLTIWLISEPVVIRPETVYNEIVFTPNDIVNIDAGGCVQTGGKGRTWKRYVDPSGPNQDPFYHGLAKLPGQPWLIRVAEQINRLYRIPQSDDMALHLGYEDSYYEDNGYWEHDDGTDDQCKNTDSAWVKITIYHIR